ncbi:MAG: CHAT domain-containing protein [Bacteroidota bacterium]
MKAPTPLSTTQLKSELLEMDDQSLVQLGARLKLIPLMDKLGQSQYAKEQVATAESYLMMVKAEVEHRNLRIPGDPFQDAEMAERVQTLDNEYFNLLQHEKEWTPDRVLNELQGLLGQINQLISAGPLEEQRVALVELEARIQESRVSTLISQRQYEEADAQLTIIIDLFESIGDSHRAQRNRFKQADLWGSNMEKSAEALTYFLDLLHQEETRPISLMQVKGRSLLLGLYGKLKDRTGAEKMLAEVLQGFLQLGYAIPQPDNLAASFSQWLSMAFRSRISHTEAEHILSRLAEIFISTQHAKEWLSSKEGEHISLDHLSRSVVDFQKAYQQKKQTLQLEDRQLLLKDKPDFVEDPPEDFPVDWSLLDRQKEIQAEIEDFRKRQEAGETSDGFQWEMVFFMDELKGGPHAGYEPLVNDILADVHGQLQEWTEAKKLQEEAIAGFQSFGYFDMAFMVLKKLAFSYLQEDDEAGMSGICGRGIALMEKLRYQIDPLKMNDGFMESHLWFHQLGSLIAGKMKDYPLMLARMERAKAGASIRKLKEAVGEEEAPPEEQGLASQIRALEAEADAEGGYSPAQLQRRRRLYDMWNLQQAMKKAKVQPAEFDLDAFQAELGEDEAVLTYFWLPQEILMVVYVDKTQVKLDRQFFDGGPYQQLKEFILYLDDMQTLHIDPQKVQQFASYLLPEKFEADLKGKKHLLISPHHLLHIFPYHLLEWQGKALFEQFSLCYIPNLSSLLLELPPSEAQGTYMLGVSNFKVPGESLSSLPGVAQEVEALQAWYENRGHKVFVSQDGQASVQQIKALAEGGELGTYRILHIATHGEDVLDQVENPMETRLFLQDGYLDALEIGNWNLNAELVILSACHSGRRSYQNRHGGFAINGDEMFGLQAAFFQAGTQYILGSLWPAHDEATQQIMMLFHQFLAKMSPEEALQATMKQFLSEMTAPETAAQTCSARDLIMPDDWQAYEYTNPAYWAPFFLTRVGKRRKQA